MCYNLNRLNIPSFEGGFFIIMATYAPNDVISTYSGSGSAGSGLDDYLKNMPNLRNAFYTQGKNDITDYLGRYTGAINNQEPLSHMQDRIGRELNLPNLRTSANTLNTTLANIPYTYSGATRGFDVNANQLNRIIGTKSAALAPTVTAANNALSSAEGQLTQRMGLEQTQQAKQLLPYQSEQTLLNDRLARESTGFTQEAQGQLNAYIDKLDKGVALSRGEQDNAERLATAKLAYDQAIAVANIQASASKYNADRSLEGTKYTANKNPFGI